MGSDAGLWWKDEKSKIKGTNCSQEKTISGWSANFFSTLSLTEFYKDFDATPKQSDKPRYVAWRGLVLQPRLASSFKWQPNTNELTFEEIYFQVLTLCQNTIELPSHF